MKFFNRKKKWKNFNGNVNIIDDLSKSDISKLIVEPHLHSLQLYEFKHPSDKTWNVMNSFFERYPEISLRVLWYNENDFSFFKKIPNVRNFTIASFLSKDFNPIGLNTKLHHFGIEETKSTSVDISFIREFSELKSLYIDGMKKGLENITHLEKLQKLTLRGIRKDNLDFLTDLDQLSELHLLFGSYKNLESLANLKNLKSIEFSRVRQIPDFDFLNTLSMLEVLEFEGMSELESIPCLDKLRNLKRLHVHNNLRLKNLEAMRNIPNLKVFQISFAENSKVSEQKNLIEQAVDIILNSPSIKYTNITQWTDDNVTRQIESKGIEKWTWNQEI